MKHKTNKTPALKKHKTNILSIISLVVFFGIILALLLLRLYVFEPYRIHGQSMSPTLKNGQEILVKLGHPQPKIGDIVIFTESGLAKYNQPNTLQLVKRVVALAGDRVKVNNGTLTVYDNSHPNGFDPDNSDGLSSQNTSGNINTIVSSGDIYVLGDNRYVSLDSREFGQVPVSSIIGRVISH